MPNLSSVADGRADDRAENHANSQVCASECERNVDSCSARDGLAHGVYMGTVDAAFASMLTALHAPPQLFSALIHGSSAATVLGQWGSARVSDAVNRPAIVLGACTFFQGLLLLSLVVMHALMPLSDRAFALAICFAAIGCVAVGNIASPLWHRVWASSISPERRMATLANRGHRMVAASILAACAGQVAFGTLSLWSVFNLLLLSAAMFKIWSSFTIFTLDVSATMFARDENLYRGSAHNPDRVAISKIPREIWAMIPGNIGIGLCAALLVPYLATCHGLTAYMVFTLFMFDSAGQFAVTRILANRIAIDRANMLLTVSAVLLVAVPGLWLVANGLLSWALIFLIGGAATGIRSLGLQSYVHLGRSPSQVSQMQACVTIFATGATIVGGVIGAALLVFMSGRFESYCISIFSLSIALRLASAVFLPEPETIPLVLEAIRIRKER